jgi:hypothetical protein
MCDTCSHNKPNVDAHSTAFTGAIVQSNSCADLTAFRQSFKGPNAFGIHSTIVGAHLSPYSNAVLISIYSFVTGAVFQSH